MLALWTAFDLTGMQTSTEAGLVIGVGILVLFVGFKIIKRTGRAI